MSFTCWNAPNVRYNTLEKQTPNSTLDPITIERMYGNQDAIPVENHNFKTHANSYWLSRYATSTSTKKNKERLKQRETSGY